VLRDVHSVNSLAMSCKQSGQWPVGLYLFEEALLQYGSRLRDPSFSAIKGALALLHRLGVESVAPQIFAKAVAFGLVPFYINHENGPLVDMHTWSIPMARAAVAQALEDATCGRYPYDVPGEFGLVFIHGQGAGVLRSEVIAYLESLDPPIVLGPMENLEGRVRVLPAHLMQYVNIVRQRRGLLPFSRYAREEEARVGGGGDVGGGRPRHPDEEDLYSEFSIGMASVAGPKP
jgi:hypothetical protein